ncbi:MAG: DUF4912 domain-containing protein [Planctomycetaceae bacterium]|jgi:hypothetical protein|nr:DUF4912 domain-containing protein [Planctomycetaceae bacterium]
MATSAELNSLTAADLGTLAKKIAVPGWSKMRKEDLVRTLAAKSRNRTINDIISKYINGGFKSKSVPAKPVKTAETPKKQASSKKTEVKEPKKEKNPPKLPAPEPKPVEPPNNVTIALPNFLGKKGLRRDISTRADESKPDRLVLMVRDPFWLHAYWEVGQKTMERTKVSLGHLWYSSIPVLRLFRLFSDGMSAPKRQLLRDVPVHGGVNNWYLDVINPPSSFLVELGYLTKEKKFLAVVSSNIVETPQQQVIDELDKLDGNWKGVADDLGRVFKLSSSTDGNNQELKEVLEEQLGRPMSQQLLSRYRIAKQGSIEKTRRNFHFSVDADLIIKGKADPNVQITVRNEPVVLNPDGTFSVRFGLPEKRHLFPIEAEGSDGVEMQRIILTIERNTRILETVIQEPNEED